MPRLHTLFGLLALTMFVGCGGGEKDGKEVKKGQKVEVEEEPEAPNGGHLVHLEPHHAVHLEVVFDEASRETTIYVIAEKDGKWEPFGLDAETLDFDYEPEDADEEVELELTAVADAEPKGSQFVLAADKLPESVKTEEDLEKLGGHVHLVLDGKEHVGELHHEEGHHHH